MKFINITNLVYNGATFLLIVFLIITTLVVYNTIRIMIFTHDTEIEIMRLVGAKHAFIRRPFLIEGMFFALFSVVFSLVCIFVFLNYIEANLSDMFIGVFQSSALFDTITFFRESFASLFIFLPIILGSNTFSKAVNSGIK